MEDKKKQSIVRTAPPDGDRHHEPFSEDAKIISDGVKLALDVTTMESQVRQLSGQVDILRQHLQQELAVNLYLQEIAPKGSVEFNDLSREKRKKYFDSVADKL